MAIWAIADLHLSFGVPDKRMDVFGPSWEKWTEKLEANWRTNIQADDLVLLPGDISWAMHIEDAVPDLEWIHRLPGTKVMIRGNHDYWWSSLSKIEKVLPSSMHLIQNNAFNWKEATIGGARLWDTPEYSFSSSIEYQENVRAHTLTAVDTNVGEAEKIFQRELGRLELSLKCLSKTATKRIAMTHYPPIGADLKPSKASEILEKYRVDICVFGHLHNVRKRSLPFGQKDRVAYHLVSADYLEFMPLCIVP